MSITKLKQLLINKKDDYTAHLALPDNMIQNLKSLTKMNKKIIL